MNVLGCAKPHTLDVETFENIQYLQRRDSLPVWWQFVYVIATVVRRYRPDPLRFVFGQIFVSKETPLLGHVGIDFSRDLALVKGIAAIIGY